MIRFGLVGCGAIHTTHADALQGVHGAVLAGLYDVVPGRAAVACEKYGVPAFASLEALCGAVGAQSLGRW